MTELNHELLHLLREAEHEIKSLRKRNEILSARVDTLDIFAAALGMRNQSQGMSVDVAWSLRRVIEEMESEDVQTP